MTATIISTNNITFLNDYIQEGIVYLNSPYTHMFNKINTSEVENFIKTLDDGKVYILSIELTNSWKLFNTPAIVLSSPILITNLSSAYLISDFIKSRVNEFNDNYYYDNRLVNDLDDTINPDIPGIIFYYKDIKLNK